MSTHNEEKTIESMKYVHSKAIIKRQYFRYIFTFCIQNMAKNDFITKLMSEMQVWHKKKLLPATYIKKIQTHYTYTQQETPALWLVKIFSILAVISIIIGSSLFFLTNGETLSFMQKILSIGMFFILIISSIFLLIKRKILLNSFILLRVICIGVWLLLVSLNVFFAIHIPLYAILFLWALCLSPFIWRYKFKYFFYFYVFLIDAAILTCAYRILPDVYMLVSVRLFTITGIIIQNISKMFVSSGTYKQHKEYYDVCYMLGNMQWILWLMLLVNSFFVTQIVSPATQYYIDMLGSPRVFALVGMLPLATMLMHAGIQIYTAKKTEILADKVKNISYKNYMWLINNLIILAIGVSFFVEFSRFDRSVTTRQWICTGWYVCIVCFLVYEWLWQKHRWLVSMAILAAIWFILMKYIDIAGSSLSLGVFITGAGIILTASVIIAYAIIKRKFPLVLRK